MRAPMQVLVIPYKITDGKPEYCVFKRSVALFELDNRIKTKLNTFL